jgi:Brp/Blh family beta-carotene 15,15'-monooxygenase
MVSQLFSKLSLRSVLLGVFAISSLAALRYLDQSVPQAALWFFLGLTLSTGFFHGALDIVLIQREFSGTSRVARVLVLYASSAILLAVLCVMIDWLLVPVLLLMSVWHFGEPYQRWGRDVDYRCAWVQRLIVGGAPVMLPVLLSSTALQTILPAAVALDAARACVMWQTLAWLWVGVGGLGLAVFRQRLFCSSLIAEVSLAFTLNLMLSPLMAFSIYFGIFHAGAHIFRVFSTHRRAMSKQQDHSTRIGLKASTGLAIAITSMATLSLLSVLVWYLQDVRRFASAHHSFLNIVLIALTAVTLPHLVLISRNADWLAGKAFGNAGTI